MLGEDFREVLSAAQSGEEWAIALLWRDLHPPVLRFVSGLLPDAGEDVESEVWLRVARDLTRFAGEEEDFRAWVFTIARHRVIDHRRRGASRPSFPVSLDEITDRPARDDPAAAAEETLGTEAALALIRRLPAAQAEVILLRVLAGLDVARVSAVVGKRPGTVRVLQHRGLRQLAEILAHEDPVHSGVTR